MKFDELDLKMRIYETRHDVMVTQGIYIVARIDGRNFSKLTKVLHKTENPFSEIIRDYMVETLKHLMNCGFSVIYGYTHSDEISLLFNIKETLFSGKHRKYISLLAGEASAKFSMHSGKLASFDCRLSELPDKELVIDYFRWRSEDARRNALTAYCNYCLRNAGYADEEIAAQIRKLNIDNKIKLMRDSGIVFEDLPSWQKNGIGVYWLDSAKEGFNPKSKKHEVAKRSRLSVDLNLPAKENYDKFLLEIIEHS